MSEILLVCSVAVVAFVLSIALKNTHPSISLIIIITTSIIILLYILDYIVDVVDYINLLFKSVNINTEYVTILLKCTGICFLTEFCCDMCKESGCDSLSSQISFAGKVITLVMAIPLFKEVLKISLSLAGVQ